MHGIGVDIGSVSVNLVVIDSHGNIIENLYMRHMGRPQEVALEMMENFTDKYDIDFVSATGTGGKQFAEMTGISFVNEIVAVSRAFSGAFPHVRTVIDIGGEDSKLIIFEDNSNGKRLPVKDFSMNALCAAGTGSFLDQQASRLRLTMEEFGNMALKSQNPPRIAGRCTVFAKSDMIHLQQIATPDYEIVAGLCHALARNFKSNVAKGLDIKTPVAFIGGVAANLGMREALKRIFVFPEDQFIIPEYFASMGAIGAVRAILEEPDLKKNFSGFDSLRERLSRESDDGGHEPLWLSPENQHITYDIKKADGAVAAYLGVDVGSISTNLVVLDEDKNILAKRYLMTEGRPLEAVKRGLKEIREELGWDVPILGAATTGSGRYLTADFIGADIVRNEITAQAEAAVSIDPGVDTVFEIGGQDSKYISIDDGVIVDFEMNKACAAGTGSFLEEQAERLGISIKEEFGELALSSKRPVKMGERCTVFIESDLVHHQQKGARTDDIVSGLSYSIVANYLNKVVDDKRVGERIFFQGGTAFNKGVAAAFEKVLKRPVTIPPHHDVTGAIGAALLAMKEKTWEKSSFKGFDLSRRKYEISTFECKGCENLCEIRKVVVENESPLFYGSRCEKYDVVRRSKRQEMTDLFKLRDDLLHGAYDKTNDEGEIIGIPCMLNILEFLPFWKAFLTELGFQVVLSDGTNTKTIKEGVEHIVVESCFPVKLAHGHVLNLIEKGVKRIFIPSVINLKSPSKEVSNTFSCPYAQSIPYTIKASIDFDGVGVKLDTPVVYFGDDKEKLLKNLVTYGRRIKRSRGKIKRALEVATNAQEWFYRECREAGTRFLSSLDKDDKVMVVIGRPYNSVDPGANLNIHKKLMDLSVNPIPLDMLPLMEDSETDEDLKDMYWGYGQKILRAAKLLRERDNYFGIYITNFGCGPDSFISHFFKKIMSGRPYLQLEIDEHSADAGIITRLEAFLDSIKNAKGGKTGDKNTLVRFTTDGGRRKLYIPNMCDHSYGLASAFRACGVDAVVMGEPDDQTVYWGRKFTTGKECYPCALTTGDMIKVVKGDGFDPEKSAFFMPSGGGPCRFGQYNRFHRMVLDELGCKNVPIYAPNQDHRLYDELNILGGRFSRIAWRSIVAVDLIMKMLHEVRPYEEVRGETDTLYEEALGKITDVLENDGDSFFSVLEDILHKFQGVKRRDTKRPVIGVVGEIYIRSNRFSNNDLIRKIEEFGGQVWFAPVSEWIGYVNYISRARALEQNSIGKMARFFLTNHIQKKDEHRIENIFKNYLSYGAEPKVSRIIEKASPYVHVSFEGEAILTVGKTIDFIEKGVSGIVNAMPFTCMPGTISGAILRIIQRERNVPVITVAYDGQGLTNIETRLEAFMFQVKDQFHNRQG